MLTWKDIENFVKNGVSAPENKVIKTEEEWKKLLSCLLYTSDAADE